MINSNLLTFKSAQSVFEQCYLSSAVLKQKQPHWLSRTQYYLDPLIPSIAERIFPRILLSQQDTHEFLAGFMAACIAECPVFLGNPHWSPQEWQQVLALIQPHHIWGDLPIPVQMESCDSANINQRGWMMIPTGGSSGQIKFAIHTWSTLTESVKGFQQFFEVDAIHSCCVLPLYHVSGLMQFMRSLLTQGQFIALPFTELVSGEPTQPEARALLATDSIVVQNFFLSLVPTQLQRLLQQKERIPWLQKFSTILLGGASPSATLLEQARQYQLNLAPTYGMTETAAQVATLKPHQFLQGNRSTGCILPHAQQQIVDSVGNPLLVHQTGQIRLQAKSLFKGYYPDHTSIERFITDDRGYLDEQGNLFVVGRSSRKIISGGENIFPEEIEAALLATGFVHEVYVTGVIDPEWGEAVTALYVPLDVEVAPETIKIALASCISRFKHPKHWIAMDHLPRNAQGKLDQAQLNRVASEYMLKRG